MRILTNKMSVTTVNERVFTAIYYNSFRKTCFIESIGLTEKLIKKIKR